MSWLENLFKKPLGELLKKPLKGKKVLLISDQGGEILNLKHQLEEQGCFVTTVLAIHPVYDGTAEAFAVGTAEAFAAGSPLGCVRGNDGRPRPDYIAETMQRAKAFQTEQNKRIDAVVATVVNPYDCAERRKQLKKEIPPQLPSYLDKVTDIVSRPAQLLALLQEEKSDFVVATSTMERCPELATDQKLADVVKLADPKPALVVLTHRRYTSNEPSSATLAAQAIEGLARVPRSREKGAMAKHVIEALEAVANRPAADQTGTGKPGHQVAQVESVDIYRPGTRRL